MDYFLKSYLILVAKIILQNFKHVLREIRLAAWVVIIEFDHHFANRLRHLLLVTEAKRNKRFCFSNSFLFRKILARDIAAVVMTIGCS